MKRVITVSREFGSGGRELGKKLAESLDIAFYDNEIIASIAHKTALAEDYVKQVLERRITSYYPITVGRSFYVAADINTPDNAIYSEQRSIILQMAEKSDCVIVGRCADSILRDFGSFNIFVYADLQSKIVRCRNRAAADEDISDKALKKKIKSVDKHRAAYYEFFTGQKWGDKLSYDICVNTSNTEVDEIVIALANMINLTAEQRTAK